MTLLLVSILGRNLSNRCNNYTWIPSNPPQTLTILFAYSHAVVGGVAQW